MLREFTIKINGKYRLFIKYVSKLRNRAFQGFENEFLKVPANGNRTGLNLYLGGRIRPNTGFGYDKRTMYPYKIYWAEQCFEI
ncbi:hypothetical protein U0035_00705 [Niabella yanshanensis]|uniref:Uncharacterized protein n=1 Tax=Niabella yanshanensis TaxID=577386 RepID=A0ABZ0W9J8_9BACT|nr:hypothetical protein [Niabella yanshanensis]WQD38665.1 hypothetical protein U0035_00705 [Niabella yanshanensis]